MKAVLSGFVSVIAGVVLIVNDMKWGEFLCLFGIVLVSIGACFSNNVVKEVHEIDEEDPPMQCADHDLSLIHI